jgi:hypothetical protein
VNSLPKQIDKGLPVTFHPISLAYCQMSSAYRRVAHDPGFALGGIYQFGDSSGSVAEKSWGRELVQRRVASRDRS